LSPISRLYILNHSHTDIGFTDHQEVVFKQHAGFIDQAIELCERTADYPPEAQYRWTCEVTGTTERYLEAATTSQLERFSHWHRLGRIDVGAMQYNFTPLLGVEQMYRSLYPVRRLRERWGLTVDTAMQSDNNGIAWLFADLLPEMGIEFLSMAINPVRGGVPKPYPMAFWWRAPSGRRLLVWNGYHYLFGRSVLKLGDWRFAKGEIERFAKKLAAREDYPFDFLFFQSTHPMRVDNGPPDLEIADFVRRWNETEPEPRLELVTHRQFATILAGAAAALPRGHGLPEVSGEWMDWWCDGVASTAFETSVARQSHQLLAMAETMSAWARLEGWDEPSYSRQEAGSAYELSSLYDEHTWGAYASVAAPHSAWSKGQENFKAGFAYRASALAHDMLARAAGQVADALGTAAPPGRFNLGDLTPEQAYPLDEERGLLVCNTLPWARRVVADEPEQRGRAAPVGVLDMFFPPGVPWGGAKPDAEPRTCAGEVPGFGFAYLRERPAPGAAMMADGGNAESETYAISVDPATGGLSEWIDKASGANLAGRYRGWTLGQFVHESVRAADGRGALFAADFSAKDFGYFPLDPPLAYEAPTAVRLLGGEVLAGRARVAVEVEGPSIVTARCTYTLWQAHPRLDVEWTLDKVPVEDPESVFFAFPLQVARPRFLGDFNGVPCEPEAEQIPGSVTAWYPVQGWIGVDGEDHSVVFVPVDAPLVHLGGVNTGRVGERLGKEPVIMSWSMNNHWFVNFKAAQSGRVGFRFSLTSMRGRLDVGTASRFAAETFVPPVVLRDRRPGGRLTGTVIDVLEGAESVAGVKPSEDGSGVVVRLLNPHRGGQRVAIDFRRPLSAAAVLLPDERPAGELRTEGSLVRLEIGPWQTTSVLVRW
jgi:alpha-mannosidase